MQIPFFTPLANTWENREQTNASLVVAVRKIYQKRLSASAGIRTRVKSSGGF